MLPVIAPSAGRKTCQRSYAGSQSVLWRQIPPRLIVNPPNAPNLTTSLGMRPRLLGNESRKQSLAIQAMKTPAKTTSQANATPRTHLGTGLPSIAPT